GGGREPGVPAPQRRPRRCRNLNSGSSSRLFFRGWDGRAPLHTFSSSATATIGNRDMDNVTPTEEVGRAPRTGEAWRESTLDSPPERCAWLSRRTARFTIAADAVALTGVAILVLAGMRWLGNDAGLHIGTVVGFALATTLVLGAFGLYGPRQLSVSC